MAEEKWGINDDGFGDVDIVEGEVGIWTRKVKVQTAFDAQDRTIGERQIPDYGGPDGCIGANHEDTRLFEVGFARIQAQITDEFGGVPGSVDGPVGIDQNFGIPEETSEKVPTRYDDFNPFIV
jgi:hypothetical protein